MRITERAAKTGTLVLVVAGLGGAVLHGLPEPVDHAVRPTTTKDVAAWTMPLDGYVLAWGPASYAENLVEQPCLRAAGIDDPPPWATITGLRAEDAAQETAARGNTSPSLAETRPLTADEASARGYRGPSLAGANNEGFRRWGSSTERNAVFDALPPGTSERCIREARSTLGTGDDGSKDAAAQVAKRLTYLAAVAARSDPSVVAAAADWRSCLADAAVGPVAGGLPADPSGLPTASMPAVDRVTDLDDEDVPRAEVRLAEQDVACQESTGYRQALYDAEWRRLLRVTASDAAVLAEGSRDQATVDRRVEETIRRLAPKAPAGVR
ncbi:hypothetical protein [Curtobacterium sp. MCBD17_030]|uniref:hypothetical protein n=1 Tax=Curtobacterium sp. MCBD17_030 TaxID=2175649 RepID=UPI000D97A950|nr:hypothetical protein [Curtobacterium sp. MCBD17_030]PYY35525.1 hypothetical protein DEI89_07240 [Curtobacterium sp. MCBD17_030]